MPPTRGLRSSTSQDSTKLFHLLLPLKQPRQYLSTQLFYLFTTTEGTMLIPQLSLKAGDKVNGCKPLPPTFSALLPGSTSVTTISLPSASSSKAMPRRSGTSCTCESKVLKRYKLQLKPVFHFKSYVSTEFNNCTAPPRGGKIVACTTRVLALATSMFATAMLSGGSSSTNTSRTTD
jgi:hypothetical protein